MANSAEQESKVSFRDNDPQPEDDNLDIIFDDEDDDTAPGLFDDEGGFGTGDENPNDGFSTNEERTNYERQIQQTQEQNRNTEAELAKERERADRAEADKRKLGKAFVESHQKTIKTDISQKEQQLIRAKEEGDTAAEVKYQGEIADLRAELSKVQEAAAQVQNEPEPKSTPQTNQPQPTQPDNQEGMQAAKDWIKKNQWYAAPASKEEEFKRNKASRINQEMIDEGKLDPSTPAYYKEIERRLSMDDRKSRGTPVSGVNNSNSGQRPAKSNKVQVRITNQEKQMMRDLKLNPSDPKILKHFAQEKLKVDDRWQQDEPYNPENA